MLINGYISPFMSFSIVYHTMKNPGFAAALEPMPSEPLRSEGLSPSEGVEL